MLPAKAAAPPAIETSAPRRETNMHTPGCSRTKLTRLTAQSLIYFRVSDKRRLINKAGLIASRFHDPQSAKLPCLKDMYA